MKTSKFKKEGPEGPSEIFPHPLSTISFSQSENTTHNSQVSKEVSYV
jgi:hypothetical protein